MQSIISLGNVVLIVIYRLPTCSSFFQLLIPHDAKQLLRKSILSPKCIFPVLQNLSPGVNLRLYHHSAEPETHIPFSAEIAETFDLLGFFRQKADCLHMRGDGTRILHSKSYCSKLSPPFAGEYSDFSVYPTRRFSPLFSGFHPFSGSATPSIHFGKTIAQFVLSLSMSLSHLGTIGAFFPARISFIISSVSSCRQNRLRM